MDGRMTLKQCALGLSVLLASCTGTLLELPPGGAPPTLAQKQRGIWIVGGLSGSTIGTTVGQVDLYDPVLDTWYAGVTALPTPVSFAGACSWGGRIYVFGGFNSSGTSLQNVQIYDIATGLWSAGTNISDDRANISAVVVSNKIYILGGSTADAGLAYSTAPSISYEYTPSLSGPGSWSTKTAMAVAGSERFLLPFDDVVYNMGGRTATSTLSALHDGLAVTSNPPNGFITTVVEIGLASARTGISGVIYSPGTGPAVMAFVGGFTTVTASLSFVAQGTSGSAVLNPSTFNYLYYPFIPPLTLQTATGKNYPSLIGFGAAALYGSTMYVFGGTSSVTAGNASGLNDVNRFVDLNTIATTGTWTAGASMPVGRYGHTAIPYRP